MSQENVAATCSSEKNHVLFTLRGHVAETILRQFCPCGMLHGVQLIEFRATYSRDKMLQEFMLHAPKVISTQEGTCPRYIFLCVHIIVILSLLNGPPTRPCYMSP